MNYMRLCFFSRIWECLQRKLIITVVACFAIILGSAGGVQADDSAFPIGGTAGFDSGLQKLANVTMIGTVTPFVDVRWGDGTPTQDSLKLTRCVSVLGGINCDVYGTHRYRLPGTYTFSVSYPVGFGTKTVSSTATISPPSGDFVILSIGDSVASGEGNPEVSSFGSVSDTGLWDDPGSDYASVYVGDLNTQEEKNEFSRRDCHRSEHAGHFRGALQAAHGNPAITVVHFACSGATATKVSDRNVTNAVVQLRVARSHLPRIDVLLLSVGANDLRGAFGTGFGGVILHCADPLEGDCSQDSQFKMDLDNSLKELPADYAALDKEIHCIDPDDDTPEPNCTDPEKQIPKLVLITEYFDPTHDKNGVFPSGLENDACTGGAINNDEWAFLYANVVVPLNQQVLHSPWPSVVGIQGDFLKHGYCASDERWVLTQGDSSFALGGDPISSRQGTGHPNGLGQSDYETRIQAALEALNPPVTTASATVGGVPYPFSTWTNQEVEVSLSAKNFIKEAGVGQTFYAVDNPDCFFGTGKPGACSTYGGPFTITTSGQHKVTFFSLNGQGHPEAVQSVQAWIDKNPPLRAVPGSVSIRAGQAALFTIELGHFGWENSTVDLTCKTDAPLATCSMLPTSVTLGGGLGLSNASSATVVTTRSGVLYNPGPSGEQYPFGLLGALRWVLALVTAVFLAATVRATRYRRWARVTHFAALAVLFGAICVGCASGTKAPGTPPGTSTVTITGTSGMTTNTVQVKMIVQ